jgi:hypothetical protein
MKELYKFFKFNGKVVDIGDYDQRFLKFSPVKYWKWLVTEQLAGRLASFRYRWNYKEHQLLATCQIIFLREVINKSAEYSILVLIYYNCS